MLTIYGHPLSSPTNKVRYVAHYLQLSYEFKTINLSQGEHRQADYLKITPYGTIPAINDNGFCLAESNAIIRYLASKTNSVLYPIGLKVRALIDQWMDYSAQQIAAASARIMQNRYFYRFKGTQPDQAIIDTSYKLLMENYLPVIEQALKNSPFIAGNSLSLADFVLLSALDVNELIEIDLFKFSAIQQWRQQLMKQNFYTKCHENYTIVFNAFMNN